MANILARQRSLIGTKAEWDTAGIGDTLVIGQGEIAIERDGNIVKAKVGDGLTIYNLLPYMDEDKATAVDIAGRVPVARTINTPQAGGLSGGGDLSTNRSLSIRTDSNGFGVRTISTSAPTGGNDGDIWYVV